MTRSGKPLLLAAALALGALQPACGAASSGPAESALDAARRAAPASKDPDEVGRWLLSELLSPGGTAQGARRARARLEALGGGTLDAALGRALDDEHHGSLDSAAQHYLEALSAARSARDARAQLYAWYAASRATALEAHAPGLWPRWRAFVETALREPGNIGWRARSELVDWWASESYDSAAREARKQSAEQYGCGQSIRIAGPFGRGTTIDATRSFDAERPGPWPTTFARDPARGVSPRVYATKQDGCYAGVSEPYGAGIFYAESFVELDAPVELVIAVQGAFAVWVDDRLVLTRDVREFGAWPRFGARVRLQGGRHRLLARLGSPSTAFRLLTPEGTPARVKTSADPRPGYSIEPPELLGDPNLLGAYLSPAGVRDPGDDPLRFVTAYLASIEGQADAATLLLEPLVKDPAKATGIALAAAADFTTSDPIFPESMQRDLAHELQARAVERDPDLWQAALGLALWNTSKAGPTEAVGQLRDLVKRFPRVVTLRALLAREYGELGWVAEQAQVAKELAAAFPENQEALAAALDVYEAQGDTVTSDRLAKKLLELDPDQEIQLTRALARGDWDAALAELDRLSKRRPDRKELADRVREVLQLAGRQREDLAWLEGQLGKDAKNDRARLSLADARFASGEHDAVRRAITDAIESGASTAELGHALDLVEALSELEPYRLSARDVIKAYEASGKHLPGNAARVLDYSAVWVRADGSSRFLEHEIVRIQSAEAIGKFAEQKRPDGLVFHARVIKSDGAVFEPEYVAGKPTITMQHLEVGDYVETEHLVSYAPDSERGLSYGGPHWFFQEADVAYARSEFVVVAPRGKTLEIESRGPVPSPEVTEKGELVVRRWRVDWSPAAVQEPNAAPPTEYLPSVRIGWGISQERRIQALADTLTETTPVDPRIARIAARIVAPLARRATYDRAQRLYRWVLANVEEGEESDGRRAIVGKSGNRWRAFITLARSLGIETRWAVARDQLQPPPAGTLSRATEYGDPLLRVSTERGPVWLTVGNKFAPFGYVPAELRGAPAFLLVTGAPERVQIPTTGARDGVLYRAEVTLTDDGSARLSLTETFEGKLGMGLRNAFSQLPTAQQHDVLESKLLGRALRGAHLESHEIQALDDLDAPLSLKMKVSMLGFATPEGNALVITPPFAARLAGYATLPSRETPLLIAEAQRSDVSLRVQLPAGVGAPELPAPRTLAWRGIRVDLKDRLEGRVLVIERVVDVPAGRVRPEEYAEFAAFVREADDAISASIRVPLGAGAERHAQR